MSNFNINDVLNKIDECLDAGANPIAAFDADGTLWNLDMGEVFFQYQIDNKLVPLPEDPWGHYLNLKKEHPPTAYLWLAQNNEGVELEVIKQWSSDCAKKVQPIPLFEEQKKIIKHLQSKNVEIYIVTASIRWAVWGAAHLYGIPEENIIGVQVSDENGKLTNKQKGPITWKAGKPEGLLLRTGGKAPFFASGNTMGDFDLLESSSHIKLVNHAAKENEELYETEKELFDLALEKKWFTLRH